MRAARKKPSATVWTIGHSTRSVAELIALLRQHAIDLLVDIRKLPRSATNPQFNFDSLSETLLAHDIGYQHMPGLTGLRKKTPGGQETAWRSKSFAAYAHYMQTNEFATALDTLAKIAADHRVALMCAEAVPWRCHRALIADALMLLKNIAVEDIIGPKRTTPHWIKDFAKVEDGHVVYPP